MPLAGRAGFVQAPRSLKADPLPRGRTLSWLGAAGAGLLAAAGLAGLVAARPGVLLAAVVSWVGMSWQTVASVLALLAGGSLALFTRARRENGRLERVVAERTRELAANEARFRGIFTDAVEGIYQSTPGGRSLRVNPAMARLCGYGSPEEMVGSLTDLETQFYLRPGRRREVNAQLEAAGALVGVESEIRRRDGSALWVAENVRVVPDPATGGTLYLGSIVDITAKRAAREELRRLMEAADAANRAKSAFLANMSHELRTPLNGILGFARLLGRDPATDARTRERLAIIESSGEHLLALINGVLDYSKIEAGRVELHPGPCHLPGLLMSLGDEFTQRAAEKGLRFRVETVRLPRMVRADEAKLRQVLLNLLGNAVKFTDRGEVSLRAERAGAREPAEPPPLRFTVADTGVGIAPERQADIFLPFHQAGDPARAAQGTGLGLSISRRLVALMGGTLHLASAPGQGSRFWFELDLPELAPADGADAGTRARPAPITGHAGPPRHVLVVDDEATNRRLAREVLAAAGFRVSEADGGAECLERFTGSAGPVPDLVLLDLRMAAPDGLETARRLRRGPDERSRGVKILASSAGDTDPGRAAALAAGCDEFIAKPLEPERLLEAVGRLLDLAWVRGEAGAPAPEPSEPVPPGEPDGWQPAPEELDALLALALQGDLLALRARLRGLREGSPPGDRDPGLQRLEALAASFQLGKLTAELRRARERPGSPPFTG